MAGFNDFIGNGFARTLAALGNEDAKEAVEMNDRLADAERYKNRKENPAWYSNDGVYRFARKLGVEKFMKEEQDAQKPKPTPFGAVAKEIEAEEKQKSVFDAIKKAGFNSNWAAGLTASVGRENDYADKNLFGTHTDAANNETNIGMISWQGDRAKKLQTYMKEKGLIDKNGKIIKGQAALDAQGEFMMHEINNLPEFAHIKKYIKDNPNASKEDVARVLGKGINGKRGYVGWAYGQDVLKNGKPFKWRDHLNKELNYRNSIDRIDKTELSIEEPKNLKNSEDLANFAQNAEVPITKLAITNQAETMMRKVKPVTSMLSTQPAVLASALRVNSLAANYTPPKLETKIEPLKEYLTSPEPQKVHVVNSNGGNISQNVSDRILAHAITGGLGMGRWDT